MRYFLPPVFFLITRKRQFNESTSRGKILVQCLLDTLWEKGFFLSSWQHLKMLCNSWNPTGSNLGKIGDTANKFKRLGRRWLLVKLITLSLRLICAEIPKFFFFFPRIKSQRRPFKENWPNRSSCTKSCCCSYLFNERVVQKKFSLFFLSFSLAPPSHGQFNEVRVFFSFFFLK